MEDPSYFCLTATLEVVGLNSSSYFAFHFWSKEKKLIMSALHLLGTRRWPWPFTPLSNSLHSAIEMGDPIKQMKDAQRGWVSCPSTAVRRQSWPSNPATPESESFLPCLDASRLGQMLNSLSSHQPLTGTSIKGHIYLLIL